ncbi:uncharacterized protein [Desmodus rotundus]|uniref:uncharacterized protein n=1 Tax=Desmodus rotundus TaxID=9430 RepID=UPI00238152EC|nr:serine/threonine-protein kinase LMTK3 [Desmodus rotundus]
MPYLETFMSLHNQDAGLKGNRLMVQRKGNLSVKDSRSSQEKAQEDLDIMAAVSMVRVPMAPPALDLPPYSAEGTGQTASRDPCGESLAPRPPRPPPLRNCPTPALSPSRPHLAPIQTAVVPVSPRGPGSSRFHASSSQEPGGAERPSPAQPLPITPRRLRGLPAPGNPGETRPGMPSPATLRQLGHPVQMIRKMKLPGCKGKTAVVVGTITDNVRIQDVPKLKVCTLRVSSRARSHILRVGGKILTFDQLALVSPKGCGTVLLSGPLKG